MGKTTPMARRHYSISCLVILVFSLVSYPFHSVWIVTVFAVLNMLIAISLYKRIALIFILIIGAVITGTIFFYQQYTGNKNDWIQAQMIPLSEKVAKRNAYNAVLPNLYHNPYFLKTYIDYLLAEDQAVQAQFILTHYQKYFIQYDYLMSFGQSFLMQNNIDRAMYCYSEAHYLIPNRFVPLAFLMRISVKEKDAIQAKYFALQIIKMNEKIPSNITATIKAEALQVFER